jgi:hypothetical protein
LYYPGAIKRKIHEPPVVKKLKDINIVDIHQVYAPVTATFVPPKYQCLYTRPFNYNNINQYITDSGAPFIHAIAYTANIWILVTYAIGCVYS